MNHDVHVVRYRRAEDREEVFRFLRVAYSGGESGRLKRQWDRQGYLRVNVNPPDPAVQALRDVRRWHLTMADGDLEMAF